MTTHPLEEERIALAAWVLRLEDELTARIERVPKPESYEASLTYPHYVAEIKRRALPEIWRARGLLNDWICMERRDGRLVLTPLSPWEMEQLRQKYFALARAAMAQNAEAA
jgi:hypothetical protein